MTCHKENSQGQARSGPYFLTAELAYEDGDEKSEADPVDDVESGAGKKQHRCGDEDGGAEDGGQGTA